MDMSRNREIDAMRGLAVLFVLLAHYRVLVPVDWAIYGLFRFEAGVPLFFAISGLVISATLIPRLQTGSRGRAIAGFYVRRIYRILPLAYLWLGLGLIGTLYFNQHGSFGDFRTNLSAAIAAVLNFANLAEAHIIFRGLGLFGPYWSLSLEEQFYLVFPLFLLLVPARHRSPAIVLVLLLLACLWRTSSGAFALADALAIDSILCGILVYLVPAPTTAIRWGRWLFLALLVLLLAAPQHLLRTGVAYTLVGVLCGLLVFLAHCGKGNVPDPWRLLSWTGRRSYGLYLAHGPCIALVQELQLSAVPATLLWLGFTFGLTELLYRLVEQPLIEAGRKRAQRIERRTAQAHAPVAPRVAQGSS
jgi:peptidoglycan/LPS O-acetylase OafA/YrhL